MKNILKKWWFWLIITIVILFISFIIFICYRLFAPKHRLAINVQSLNDDSTVYVSAGGHSIVIQSNYKEKDDFTEMFELVRNNLDYLKKYDYLTLQIYTKYYLFENKFDITSKTLSESNIYRVTSEEEEKQYLDNKTNNITIKGEDITIGAGKYIVGQDIKPGIYDAILQSGSGNFWLEKQFVNEIFNEQMQKYSNLNLTNGEVVNLSGSLQILLKAK